MANQMHALKTKILGTLWPLFCFLNAFAKALIWHKAEEYVLKKFGSIALHKLLLETKKTEFFTDYIAKLDDRIIKGSKHKI